MTAVPIPTVRPHRKFGLLESLNAPQIASYLGLLAFIAALVQIGLGAKLLVLALAMACVAVGLFGYAALGAYNLSAWIVFSYISGTVLIAVYAKTYFGQPVDSNLRAPFLAFLVQLVGVIAVVGAMWAANMIHVGKPVLKQTVDVGRLRFMSWACFALGGGAWLLNRNFADPSGGGFGGFSMFNSLLLMAVIGRTASMLVDSGGKRSMDQYSLVMMVLAAILGFLDNGKSATAAPFVSYFATLLYFKNGLTTRRLVAAALSSTVFFAVVGPVVNIYRELGIGDQTTEERISLVVSKASSLFEGNTFDYYEALQQRGFATVYYDYFGNGQQQLILGRFTTIQQIDPVIAAVNTGSLLGSSAIIPSVLQQLPGIFYPNKPSYSTAYPILLQVGLVDRWSGKQPTLPLVGQAYAAYGFAGALIITFLAFLVLALVLKKVGWQLNQNIYAIFFLCQWIVVYVMQADLGQFTFEVTRAIPLLALLFVFLNRGYEFMKARPRHHWSRQKSA